jgi:hypothetical protein
MASGPNWPLFRIAGDSRACVDRCTASGSMYWTVDTSLSGMDTVCGTFPAPHTVHPHATMVPGYTSLSVKSTQADPLLYLVDVVRIATLFWILILIQPVFGKKKWTRNVRLLFINLTSTKNRRTSIKFFANTRIVTSRELLEFTIHVGFFTLPCWYPSRLAKSSSLRYHVLKTKQVFYLSLFSLFIRCGLYFLL